MSTLIETEGIVLKTMKYGETSIISQILTRDHGLVSLIMGGVTNNARKGMFQIMSQLDLVFYHQEQKTMHRIKEARYAKIYQTLPFEIHRSAIGIFIIELIRKSLINKETDIELYDWIKSCLTTCDELNIKLAYMPLYFLVGLSRQLGFCPLNNYDIENTVFDLREGSFTSGFPFHREYLDQDCAKYLHLIIHHEKYSDLNQIVIPPVYRKQLLYGLLDYYKIHLDHFKGLDSPHILEEMLAA
jgi:DNA repair protein RecO (recombination protein O)